MAEQGTPSAHWVAHASGPATPASLSALVSADPASLTGAELIDAIVASEKALSLLAGLQIRLMAALATPFVAGDPMRLAARLARKNSMNGDDPERTELCVPEAATCLAASEIAAALRISPITAGIRVRDAAAMTTELAPTLDALQAGRIDRGKSRVITEHCQPLTPDHVAQVQNLVLPTADQLSNSELRDLTGQAVITVDPDGAEDRHHTAAARRDLTLRAQPDAMATLNAFLPADGAVKIFQISDLLATSTAGSPGDARGIGARRVDALVDIAEHLLAHGYLDITHYIDNTPANNNPPTETTAGQTVDAETADAETVDLDFDDSKVNSEPEHTATEQSEPDSPDVVGDGDCVAPGSGEARRNRGRPEPDRPGPRRALTRQGRRPHLSVIIGLGTLAGENELPAKLAGFGAIPASLGRAIATSAGTITALLADQNSGVVTHAGALTYRPTQRLRDQVAALTPTCQFPSCRQPVWRCDIDHREPFDHQNPKHGGHTDPDNTGPFCRRHHLVKHHTEWRFRVNPEMFLIEWISPTGHHYSKKQQPTLPAELRITTPGTAIAERLDLITTIAGPTAKRGQFEELLTTMLLHHRASHRHIEYTPEPTMRTRWDEHPSSHHTGSGEMAFDDHPESDDPFPDEAPPF